MRGCFKRQFRAFAGLFRVYGGGLRNSIKAELGDGKMIEIVVSIITASLPIILGYIVYLLKEQKKERNANSKGTMLLLRVQLIEYHARYTEMKEIPTYAYQNFCEMYDAYHELGGNGMVTKMYEEIQELHLKTNKK